MGPRRSFWVGILVYGILSVATVAPSARSEPGSAIGVVVGSLVVTSAGYALLRPERAGGPEEWNAVALAAVGGAVPYAVAVVVGAV